MLAGLFVAMPTIVAPTAVQQGPELRFLRLARCGRIALIEVDFDISIHESPTKSINRSTESLIIYDSINSYISGDLHQFMWFFMVLFGPDCFYLNGPFLILQ